MCRRMVDRYSEMCARLLICAIMLALVAENRANPAMTMEQIEKTALTLRNTCASKANADLGLVAGMQKGEFPEDQNVKCYTLCIMKTLRTFKNGRLELDMMLKQLDLMMPVDRVPRMKEVMLKCGEEPPTGDDCETTYQFVKCNYRTDPEYFFFP